MTNNADTREIAVGTMKSKETTVETPTKPTLPRLLNENTASNFKHRTRISKFIPAYTNYKVNFDKTLSDSLPRLTALSGKNFIPDIDMSRTVFAEQ
jgi:hypothetical protein